mmetsp:Transcript_114526/g.370182  ORF Transcript_114526/g.370182 Transcript_114526/m.370182 type:complete len:217 (-) Transcript_114526:1841-2491(-)
MGAPAPPNRRVRGSDRVRGYAQHIAFDSQVRRYAQQIAFHSRAVRLQALVQALVLGHHHGQIHAAGGALEAHEPVHELFGADAGVAVEVQEVVEGTGLPDVQLQQTQTRSGLIRRELELQLLARERAGVVGVRIAEQGLERVCLCFPFVHVLLNDQIFVDIGDSFGILDEHPSHDVEDPESHDDDEKDEAQEVAHVQFLQRLCHVAPVNASRYGLE